MNNGIIVNTPVFAEAGFVIQIHIVAAVTAFFLGSFVLWRKKGGRIHRILGRLWVLVMTIVAGGSFFINELRVWGEYSPIHLLSVATLISLVLAIFYARKGMIRAHRQTMQSLYLGAMVVAGGLAFMPGRIMYRMLVEPVITLEVESSVAAAWQVPLVAAGAVAVAYYLYDFLKRRA